MRSRWLRNLRRAMMSVRRTKSQSESSVVGYSFGRQGNVMGSEQSSEQAASERALVGQVTDGHDRLPLNEIAAVRADFTRVIMESGILRGSLSDVDN